MIVRQPLVRMKGLEPPRPETLDPKSNAATNYATCAGLWGKGRNFFGDCQIFFIWRGAGSFWSTRRTRRALSAPRRGREADKSDKSDGSDKSDRSDGSGRWDFWGRGRGTGTGGEMGMDAMRGCGCSGEQPYFFGGDYSYCCYCCCCCCCFLAVRAVCIEVAAARPSPIARITVAPPRTMSPPA